MAAISATLFPNLSQHDPAALIPMGRGIQWEWIADGLMRLLATSGILGMLHAWLPRAGRFTAMATAKPLQVRSESVPYPQSTVSRRPAPRDALFAQWPKLRWALGACVVVVMLLGAAYGSLVDERRYKEEHPNSRRDIWPGSLPFRLEMLWSEADALNESGRYFELVDVFQKIAELQPDNPRVWFHQAYTMAYNIGQSQRGAARRWRWYRRAIVHATGGAKAHPDNWRLAALRFNIWRGLVADDREVDRICQRQLGHDGLY
ncbi:MAG: hypothetical protein QGF59_18795, partial [Pirellulaceae bacterium]|nr:hypothetical protein [Pirellulaceae bacterium]